MALLTLGGSAVFVYGGAIGSGRIGMSPFAVSLAYSANAAAGIPSARWRGARPGAGGWLVATAAAAVVLGVVTTAPAFWAAMVVWGFAFWMGVPGVFSLLADRSVHPAERVGDAQAAMAAGRVAGPLLGGVLVGTGSTAVLGLVGGGLVLAAAVTFLVVELRVPARASSSRSIA